MRFIKQYVKDTTHQVGTHIYNVSGTYLDSLKTKLTNCDSIITTHLTLIAYPTLNLGKDTSLCDGQTMTLKVSIPNATYLWHDLSTDSTFFINQAGTYWVRATINATCFTSDTIHITYKHNPVVNLGKDTALCYGQTYKINAAQTNASYHWQDGSNKSYYIVSPPYATKLYWVMVTINHCTTIDSIIVIDNPVPQVDFGTSTSLCPGQIIVLDATNVNCVYIWNDSTKTPTYTATSEGTYWVVVKDTTTNCTTRKTITFDCIQELIIPNIFTPNGDGHNDYFEIKDSKGWNNNLQVFDRWGKMVYENLNYQNNWDGQGLVEGVYFYSIKAMTFKNRVPKLYSGSLTILR